MSYLGRPQPAAARSGIVDPGDIAFDVDGVIADTMSLFLDIARDEFGIHHVCYEDIRCYNLEDCVDIDPAVIERILDRILEGGYRAPLQVIPGAPEVLERLARRGRPVLMVTARPHPGPIEAFLRRLLPKTEDALAIVATGSFESKTAVLRERCVTHFVEDRLETCYLLQAAGITPVLFAQPWNREPHPFIEVSSWQQIDELIRW